MCVGKIVVPFFTPFSICEMNYLLGKAMVPSRQAAMHGLFVGTLCVVSLNGTVLWLLDLQLNSCSVAHSCESVDVHEHICTVKMEGTVHAYH